MFAKCFILTKGGYLLEELALTRGGRLFEEALGCLIGRVFLMEASISFLTHKVTTRISNTVQRNLNHVKRIH